MFIEKILQITIYVSAKIWHKYSPMKFCHYTYCLLLTLWLQLSFGTYVWSARLVVNRYGFLWTLLHYCTIQSYKSHAHHVKSARSGGNLMVWLEFSVASLLKILPKYLRFWIDIDFRQNTDSFRYTSKHPHHPPASVMLCSGAFLWLTLWGKYNWIEVLA